MQELVNLVKEKYQYAKEGNHLFFFESIHIIKECSGVPFQISYVPSLAKKPGVKKDEDNKQKEPINPFLNPDPNLIVKEYEEYSILLNKFCVVPHHLLIITKEYHSQSLPLFPPDLFIAWKILHTAYGSTPGLVFYNCGTHSGASQPHKHMQLIPLSSSGLEAPIQTIIDKIENPKAGEIYTLNQFPFVHVLTPLDRKFIDESSDETIEDYLGQMFFGLLDGMFQQLRLNSNDDDEAAKIIRSKPSFNFIMTRDFMLLIPRKSESAIINIESLLEPITISLNSLAYAGFLLAKTEIEKNTLYQHPDLLELIKQVGFERTISNEKIPTTTVDENQSNNTNVE